MTKKENASSNAVSRRDVLKTTALAGMAAAASAVGLRSHEERCLARAAETMATDDPAQPASEAPKPDAVSGATRTSFNVKPRAPLNAKVPLAKICDLTVSRIILGGNLIGGYAHSRDLIYVSDLIKAYHTEQKCVETFMLAEECGINAFLGDWNQGKMMENYWKWTDGKIQLISQCTDDLDVVKRTIDCGSVAVYPQGETCDRLVREGNFDRIEKIVTMIRDAKLPVGLGAHRIETLQAILDKGIVPDFWMKTYHPLTYWSAHAETEHDNIYCRKPDVTREFFESRPEPWIAFKTLAAGAVTPQEGFRFALEGGADFLCVGMYDFQIVDDVNIYTDIVKNPVQRSRRSIDDVDRDAYEKALEEEEENA
ncbi:MAG: twin-arginine translocation signal domain-containing protein [Thermoguttaceae bacterium]|nr:twin-arginine translocation signal domain-containing protein [Thermoguttaceae bacterium]MBQ4204924.1 twin-arginine translocation signal domain-containing protein [Thermoguttaceae bacterium]MBQ5368177.1 twin-arginine translocation signal domain-containing protein [Thermoguttaceae bacterium]